MTTINFSAQLPANIANLSVAGAVGGGTLKWNASSELTDKYQIWHSNDSNVANASIIATVESNHFSVSNLSPTTNNYYWVNTINEYGVQGPKGNAASLTQSNVTVNQVIQSNVFTSGTSFTANSSSVTVTNYDTWYSPIRLDFTASAHDLVNMFFVIGATVSNANVGLTETLEVKARTRLYDNTISSDVPAGIDNIPIYMNIAGVPLWNTSGLPTYINKQFLEGFKNLLTAGHSYSWYLEVGKFRVVGNATCNVSLTTTGSGSSAATIT